MKTILEKIPREIQQAIAWGLLLQGTMFAIGLLTGAVVAAVVIVKIGGAQ